MKKALVIGISGQDGAYLSRLLLEKNYGVVGTAKDFSDVEMKNLRYLGLDSQVELVAIDLTDLKQWQKIIERYRPDEIYNLAAQSSVGLSFKYPLPTLSLNINSAICLLESVRTVHPSARIFQASSCEMFGNIAKQNLPVTETSPLAPVSPYAVSKAAAHWMAINYRQAYNIFVCCGILFNHESVLRGECFVTKKIINTAVKIKMGLADKLCLGNLNVYKDWGYAPEYVKAMWLMLQQEHADDYVVCSGETNSLETFVRSVFAKLGLKFEERVEIDQSLYRPLDLEIIYGDNRKSKEQLGWQYDFTFADLIARLVEDELAYVSKDAGLR